MAPAPAKLDVWGEDEKGRLIRIRDELAGYESSCTVSVTGIKYEAAEADFLPTLLTANGNWPLPNKCVIGVNIVRFQNQVGRVIYKNRGEVFIRFRNQEYLNEFIEYMEGSNLMGRAIHVFMAARDLALVDTSNLRMRPDRPRFFNDCFTLWNEEEFNRYLEV